MALEVEFNPSQFNNVLGGRRLEYVSKLSDIKTNCYTAMLNTMCVRSGTRIIHMLTILSVLSVIVFGKNCDCDEESFSYPNCGIIPTDPTIVNGTSSSYPWMVFLYMLENTGDSFCGGTLISDLQVATAAHCVVGKTTDEVAVILGTENAKEELRKFNFRYIFKIEIYPLYEILDKTLDKTFKETSDVAILTLEKSLDLSPKVNPICLPSDAEAKETYVDKDAIVAGWGKTKVGGNTSMEQQMQVKIPIISNADCQIFYDWIRRFYIN